MSQLVYFGQTKCLKLGSWEGTQPVIRFHVLTSGVGITCRKKRLAIKSKNELSYAKQLDSWSSDYKIPIRNNEEPVIENWATSSGDTVTKQWHGATTKVPWDFFPSAITFMIWLLVITAPSTPKFNFICLKVAVSFFRWPSWIFDFHIRDHSQLILLVSAQKLKKHLICIYNLLKSIVG